MQPCLAGLWWSMTLPGKTHTKDQDGLHPMKKKPSKLLSQVPGGSAVAGGGTNI